jgi:Helix-turn-helix domain
VNWINALEKSTSFYRRNVPLFSPQRKRFAQGCRVVRKIAPVEGGTAEMAMQTITKGAASQKFATAGIILLTPVEAARLLKVSMSWLAKARMHGNGPPFLKIGRSIRYNETSLQQWMDSMQRLSTSQ